MFSNATVTFSMIDVNCGKYIIANKSGSILLVEKDSLSCGSDNNEYIIYYEFKSKDTKKSGIFLGEFTINFFDSDGNSKGDLKVPMSEKLNIFIESSFSKTSVNGF